MSICPQVSLIYSHRRAIFIIALALLLVTGALQLQAQASLTGYNIMKVVREQGRLHKNQKYDIFMQITNKKNKERTRYFSSWNKYKSKKDLSLVRFYKPSNLNGTALLSVTRTGEQANQWLYLPAFRSVKKLSTNDRHKSFMGSDFSNADIGGRSLNEDTHELIAKDEKHYTIRSTPKSADDQYGMVEYLILRSPAVIRSAKFFDHNNQLIKTLTNKKIRQHENMYIAVHSVMENPNSQSRTVLKVERIDTQTKKTDSFYSTRGLQQ